MASWDQAEETKKGRGKMVGGKGGRGSKKEKAEDGGGGSVYFPQIAFYLRRPASLGANGPVIYPPVPLLSGAKRDACYIAVVRRA